MFKNEFLSSEEAITTAIILANTDKCSKAVRKLENNKYIITPVDNSYNIYGSIIKIISGTVKYKDK
jgi:hypothetical protein